MPPDEVSSAYLHDMLKAARLAFAFVRLRTAGDLLTDPMLMAALEREVQIVGEAARKIEESFKEAHADVPWRKIIATRHILVHDYDDVDHEGALVDRDGSPRRLDSATREDARGIEITMTRGQALSFRFFA